MKPLKLRINNFGSHIDNTINFTNEPSLIGVVGYWDHDVDGSNGSGKSTFVDAINFALFGVTRTGVNITKDTIRTNQNNMLVEYEFEYNNTRFRIVRNSKVTSGGNLKNNALLYENDKLMAEGVKEVGTRLNIALDYSFDLFNTISFFGQGKADNFIKAKPGERLQYLRKIEDIDYYDELRVLARKNYEHHKSLFDSNSGREKLLSEMVNSFNLESVNKEIDLAEKTISHLKTRKEESESKISELKRDKEKSSEYAKHVKDLKLHESNYKSLSDDIKTASDEVDNLKKSLELFGDVKKPDDTSDLVNKLSNISTKISYNSNIIENHKHTYNHYMSKCVPKITKLKSDMDSIKVVGSNCPSCDQPLPKHKIEDIINNINKDINDLESEAPENADMGSINKENEVLEAKKLEIQGILSDNSKIQENYNNYVNAESKYKISKNNLDNNKKTLENVDTRIKEINNEMSKYNGLSLCSDVSIIDSKILKEEDEIKVISKDIDEKTASLYTLKASIDNYHNNKLELDKSLELKKDSYHNMDMYQILIDAFSRDGIPKLISDNALLEIEKITNDIIGDISDNIKIYFVTEKSSKSGNISDTLDIMVEMDGHTRDINTYSGGEKTLVSFAVRFAISSYMSNKSEKSISLVVLDEVFGALDKRNRSRIVSILNVLKQRFSCIIVISHTQMRDIFPKLITFIRNNDGTKLAGN